MTLRQHSHGTTRAELEALPACSHCGRRIGPREPYFQEDDDSGATVRASHAVPLFFDECSSGTKDLVAEMGFCVVGGPSRSTPDVEWLAQAGDNGWTVITRDRQIARRSDELAVVARHKVKCFMLPTVLGNRGEEVRAFVTMWDKIRTESLGTSGPFIWQFNAESSPVRWELAYPEPLEFAAYDLSKVPIGHLLNMFAHVVTEHDQGWFSRSFVDDLHDNIRLELEARLAGDRSIAVPPSDIGELIHSGEITRQQQQMKLDKPVDLGGFKLITLVNSPKDGSELEYIWPIPAPKAAANIVNAGETLPDAAFGVSFGPTGFHRIGFKMEINPRRWGRRRRR